jgi:MFS family permease
LRTLLARDLGRDARLHLVTPLAIGVAYYGLFVVAFNLYLVRLGYDTSFIGYLGAAGTACFVAFSLPAAAFGRRWGARRALLVGTGAYLVGFTALPFADLLPLDARTAWLVTTYLIAFMGGPFYWVNGSLYLMAATEAGQRPRAFALRTAGIPFAGVVGSLVGGAVPGWIALATGATLDDAAPFRVALFASGLAYLPAFLATLASRDLRPPVEPLARSRPRLPWTLIAVVGVVEAARMAGEVGTYGFYNVHLDRLGVAPVLIGAVVAVGFALSGGAALLAPTLTRRWGSRPTIAWCMVAMAGAIALLAVPTPSAAFVGYVATGALAAVGMAALSAYRMELVAPAAWAAMAGVAVTGQGVGESLVLLAGGVTIEALGFTPYFLGVAALVLAGALFVALRLRPAPS